MGEKGRTEFNFHFVAQAGLQLTKASCLGCPIAETADTSHHHTQLFSSFLSSFLGEGCVIWESWGAARIHVKAVEVVVQGPSERKGCHTSRRF